MSRRAMAESFAELVERPLRDGVNALCWRRTLVGDFGEVARALAPADGVVDVDAATLRGLALTAAGRAAAAFMEEDLNRLEDIGREPVLSCITRYPRDTRGLAIATDVMSFHADRAPVEVDTWLCTYWGKSSEGLDNEDGRRLVDDPAVRQALLRESGAADDDAFEAWLREGSFDLHYRMVQGGAPFSFGVGNLWRVAAQWPGCPVPPCLHRAPPTDPHDEPRLLLIC